MRPKQTLILTLLLVLLGARTADADSALKTIQDPSGGTIIYGQVEGATTQDGAIASILRSVRAKWGNEPQIGKFFRVKNTNSIAVFLSGINHAKNDLLVAALVIVSQVSPDRVEGAFLMDDAKRFGNTINPMLGNLQREWHPAASAESSQSASSVAVSAPLHPVMLADRSASASLPDGWQITPASAGGTIIADGPNGERVYLGFTLLAWNISDPRVMRTRQFAQGAGRNTSYAHALYYPYGADITKMFVDLSHMNCQRQGQPQGIFQIASTTDLPAPPGWRRVYLNGHVDPQDGVGMREMNTIFSCGPLGRAGSFMTYFNHAAVPVQFADQEHATMLDVISSYSANQQVISQQAGAFAAPEIARIHEIGRRAAAQAAASHAASDAHNAAVERHWDANDKAGQAFGNYLLDQTVIKDNNGNTHSTVWNQTADALVRSDPQRYEYVTTPNLRRGVDF